MNLTNTLLIILAYFEWHYSKSVVFHRKMRRRLTRWRVGWIVVPKRHVPIPIPWLAHECWTFKDSSSQYTNTLHDDMAWKRFSATPWSTPCTRSYGTLIFYFCCRWTVKLMTYDTRYSILYITHFLTLWYRLLTKTLYSLILIMSGALMILPCSLQNLKTIEHVKRMSWSNEFSRALRLRWVSDGYPILQIVPEPVTTVPADALTPSADGQMVLRTKYIRRWVMSVRWVSDKHSNQPPHPTHDPHPLPPPHPTSASPTPYPPIEDLGSGNELNRIVFYS